MPLLDLSGDDVGLIGTTREVIKAISLARLKATAFYPNINDEVKRLNYLRYLYQGLDIKFEDAYGEHSYKYLSWKSYFRSFLNFLGGKTSFIKTPSSDVVEKEIKDISGPAMLVGRVFSLIYGVAMIDREPNLASLNRIIWYLEITEKLPKSTFLNTWNEFKSVSHFWAAINTANMLENIDSISSDLSKGIDGKSNLDNSNTNEDSGDPWKTPLGREIENTFAWALEFQQFGISFTPQHSKGPILDPNETWILQEDDPWELRPLFGPNRGMVMLLREYRAPKPGTNDWS